MITAEKFLGDIRIDVNQCPDPIIERELRKTIIYLCEQAQVWIHRTLIESVNGERDYLVPLPKPDDITLDPQSDVHSILGLWLDDRIMESGSHHDEREQAGRTNLTNDSAYLSYERGMIRLFRELDGTERLEILVSLKPSREAEEYPSFTSSDYHEGIVHGTVGRLMMMRGREWSDPQTGTWHRRKFDECVLEARQAVDRGHSTSTQRLKPRRFAPGRRSR